MSSTTSAVDVSGSFVTPISHSVVKKTEVSNVVNKYADSWTTDGTNDEANRQDRMSRYEEITNSYYNLATDFYEFGWGTSFHFAPIAYGETLERAIARHEHYLAMQLNISEGMRVADLGCGVGGPMREIATFTGATIVGVNNNAYQCKRGTYLTDRARLTNQCSFVKGDFMNLSFPDNSFDAVYAIEALCHAPDLEQVYREIKRILKPGGRFGSYEWCMTDNFDPNDNEHLRIKKGIEIGDGIADLRTTKKVSECLRSAGFKPVLEKDLSEEGYYKWYSPLDSQVSLQGFARSQIGRMFTNSALSVLETVGLAPQGTLKVQKLLCEAADNLVKGSKDTKIFTPMYLVVGEKPL